MDDSHGYRPYTSGNPYLYGSINTRGALHLYTFLSIKNKMRLFVKKRQELIFFIIVLSALLRFFHLDSVPPGLGRDEVSVAYNAFSILKTGRDEHQRFLPVYFEAIGDQKLPVIVYLSTISVGIFGLTELGARFPFAFLGTLTIVSLYLLMREYSRSMPDKNLARFVFLAPILLAINPWHMAHSRAVYEILLGTFFFTTGMFCFLKALISRRWFILSLFLFILAFYTYSMTRLLSPLLFLTLVFIYRKSLNRFSPSFKLLILALAAVSLIPFAATFFSPGGVYGPAEAVIFTSGKIKSLILEFRTYLSLQGVSLIGSLFFNKFMMTFYEYGKNILASLSPEFYFAKGSEVAGIGTNGQFYMIEFLPFMVGLVYVLRRAWAGDRFLRALFAWIILTILSASLTINPPYATRTLFLVVPVIAVISLGWLKLFLFIKEKRKKAATQLFAVFIVSVYLWHTMFYLLSYYLRFPVVYAKNWESENKELFTYLKNQEPELDRIVITHPEESMYAFLLFYHQIDPAFVWSHLERHGPDSEGWKHAKKLGKYEFRSIDDWAQEWDPGKNVLLVVHGGEHEDRTDFTREFYYPMKYTVFADGRNIVGFPEKRVAYRIYKYVKGELVKE